MASLHDVNANAAAARPLADYFFIAGIESSQIFRDDRNDNACNSPAPVEATIDEDRPLEVDDTRSPTPAKAEDLTPAKRFSYASVLSDGLMSTASNRSSVTIRPVVSTPSAGFNDEEFEKAIRKFASERESFLEEIHISAGTVTSSTAGSFGVDRTTKTRPKTTRVSNTPDQQQISGLRSGVGSIRRRLSTMNSLKRQPSTSRQSSIRTSKRMSGYNSVIPAPRPFQSSPDMHPLKRRYEPVLLDRYPTKSMIDEPQRRCLFPDYVPMFAFPNDVSVVSSDDKPRSTWHGFAMTAANGSKLHAVCVTIWIPLNDKASSELERQCEAWRKENMSDEERELAASLGERVAAESARLSKLLAKLPTVPSESSERETLIEEIMATQEKIELMADLLRPVRHGAASRIDGLTDGDTGFWIPRVFGVLGRDVNRMPFWKEWLKAVIVPMTKGAILRVPPSSPRVGMWQPLERYVVNMLVEAPSPLLSITQIEVAVRELRLYARNEAVNELPDSRGVDLYALFRTLSIPTIVTLFEYALAESRIIIMSSHTAMLYLATTALVSLLYPLKWSGVYIPILPARLLQAIEAPCPYIVGVEKRFDKIDFPEDDFVLVDLDQGMIESTAPPPYLPRQIKRKLTALLQAAAPHHDRFGVPLGPPRYAMETFPNDAFISENPQVFTARPRPGNLARSVNVGSAAFADPTFSCPQPPVYNAFVQARQDMQRLKDSRPGARPPTRSNTSPPISPLESPNGSASPSIRTDSALGLQAALREKRSARFESVGRRNSSLLSNTMRWPNQPFSGHISTLSTSALPDSCRKSNYASSVYAASTMAASTIMPAPLKQQVRDNETTKWSEGHCMVRHTHEPSTTCTVCDESCEEAYYECKHCPLKAHSGCTDEVVLVCPAAFRPDLVRAAFVRCFASLIYTYRRYLRPTACQKQHAGLIFSFQMDAFMKSVPGENLEYMRMLQQTQAFNQFVYERESTKPDDPSIKLFDEVVLAKKNRGKRAFFSKTSTPFVADISTHVWRSALASPQDSRLPGDYQQIVSRTPSRLDPTLVKEPRATQGTPRPGKRATRKPIPSMLGLAISNTCDAGGQDCENQDPTEPSTKLLSDIEDRCMLADTTTCSSR